MKLLKIYVLLLLVTLSACKIKYTFSGISLPPEVKTVSVDYFPNYAPIVQPTLSQLFTEGFKDKLLNETPLSLVDEYGDITFSGQFTDYSVKAQAVSGDETASMNRLSITVNVVFTNSKDPEADFEKKFTRYADFEADKDISSVEGDLIETIITELLDDIFNAALAQW